jgi:probable rRNA maturation factor
MIYLTIADSLTSLDDPLLEETGLYERAAQAAMHMAGAPSEAGLTIVITDDAQLADLNRRFLEINAPTDVLSFPTNGPDSSQAGTGETDPETGASYLGDVIISYPRAQAQAADGGHSVRDELQLLVVHGVLHLLGYDHADAPGKEAMWSLQADALKGLGAAISGPPL